MDLAFFSVPVLVLSAGALLFAGAVCWLFWRDKPIKLTLSPLPRTTEDAFFGLKVLRLHTDKTITYEAQSKDNTKLVGMVGELLTGLIMAADGWRQLPSQPSVYGLDGVFVRAVNKRQTGFEVALVETKTTRYETDKAVQAYEKTGERGTMQMAHDRVFDKLQLLADQTWPGDGNTYLDANAVHAIRSALKRHPNSKYVGTYLMAHGFKAGTEFYRLDKYGTIINRHTPIRPAHATKIFEALAMGLARLPRIDDYHFDKSSVANTHHTKS